MARGSGKKSSGGWTGQGNKRKNSGGGEFMRAVRAEARVSKKQTSAKVHGAKAKPNHSGKAKP